VINILIALMIIFILAGNSISFNEILL